VELNNADLREIITDFKSSLDLPFDLIAWVSQRREPEAPLPDLTISFNSEVKIPIPFAFLGYHPGVIIASQVIQFSETRPVSADTAQADADAVYVMRLAQGEIVIDIDDWLEWLLPSLVQDMSVDIVCIFHYKNEWYCLLSGTGLHRDNAINEFFNFTQNRIIFPIPAEFVSLGERIVKASAETY
jgi:hypothetical protein